jgi:outer membrane protein OmpA-like peptidoglycan-associated protein
MRLTELKLLVVLGAVGCGSAVRQPDVPQVTGGAVGASAAASSAGGGANAGSATVSAGAPNLAALDQDRDGIPDAEDACPTEEGGPSPNRGLHGCRRMPLAEGTPSGVHIHPIRFDAGSSLFKWRQNVAELEQVASLMKQGSSECLLVEGHSDSKTDPSPGTHLSLARARSIQAYLLERAVPNERIAVRGLASHCERKPGNLLNRRVSICVLACPLPTPLPEPACDSMGGFFPIGPGQADAPNP